MIRTLCWIPGAPMRSDVSPSEIRTLLGRADALLWVDLADEEPSAFEPLLRDTLHFHPLAVEDALRERHIAKIDDWGDYIYLVVHGLHLDLTLNDPVQLIELDLFVGRNYVITHHERDLDPLEEVWEALESGRRPPVGTPARLLHLIMDELVASHLPVVEAIDDAIEQVKEAIFSRSGSPDLEQILQLKRGTIQLRRAIGPQREVYSRLARDPYVIIAEKDRVYFRDIFDQAMRLMDIIEGTREQADSALETHLSAINNRLNDVMKTLTIITTLFMPLSFVASFFGMNFFAPVADLAAWTGKPALAATLALMAVTPGVMYLWMRRRHWM